MVASPRKTPRAICLVPSPLTSATTGDVTTPCATSGTAFGLIDVGFTGQPDAIVPSDLMTYARPEPPTPGAGDGDAYVSSVLITMSFVPSPSTSAIAALAMIARGAKASTPAADEASKTWIGKGAMRVPSACQT